MWVGMMTLVNFIKRNVFRKATIVTYHFSFSKKTLKQTPMWTEANFLPLFGFLQLGRHMEMELIDVKLDILHADAHKLFLIKLMRNSSEIWSQKPEIQWCMLTWYPLKFSRESNTNPAMSLGSVRNASTTLTNVAELETRDSHHVGNRKLYRIFCRSF